MTSFAKRWSEAKALLRGKTAVSNPALAGAPALFSSRLSRAVALALSVSALEWAVVCLSERRQIANLWELQFGTLWLLPAVVALSLPVAMLGASLWSSFEQCAEKRGERTLFSVLIAGLGAALALSVSTGRQFEDPGLRAAFVSTLMIVSGALAWSCGPALSRAAARAVTTTAAFILGLILLLELCNRFVLVRLYPEWHAVLAVLTVLLAPGCDPALRRLLWGLPSSAAKPASAWRSRLAVLALGGAALVTVTPASARLAHFDNFQWLLMEQAPLLARAVEFSAKVRAFAGDGNPESIVDELAPREVERAPAADFRGRDILLVTVDALRADHLGCYGYGRPTSPHIDELAEDAVLFEYAYCPTPHTSYSVTSLLTGKYLRPLLLQGLAEDSTTLPEVLRTYGYSTAGFYPPAIFFIDQDRFTSFESRGLGFEYRKVEFAEGELRVSQVREYLSTVPTDKQAFVWVHLFGPHEPYEHHAEHDFGQRDIDRYDSEIAAADVTVGKLSELIRSRDPRAVVIVSADHGEEFAEHGGRYHGSSVYEEQARVPLIISAKGLAKGRVLAPVQTIDLFATLLTALQIPLSPRVRGQDLSGLLLRPQSAKKGFAFAETDDMTLVAEAQLRLVCRRKLGACQLFDLDHDPGQTRDRADQYPHLTKSLREKGRELNATHGTYERRGLRSEGKAWPAPILRGIAGDADAAIEIASLLDDADPELRTKAAELIMRLKVPATAPALRLALARDEDRRVRNFAALALVRLGQGAPLVFELLKDTELSWRRWAALVLAENGDARGEAELVAWWQRSNERDFETSREILTALGRVRAKSAVGPLAATLADVRLRPYITGALADIGDFDAAGPLLLAFRGERYQGARVALAEALVKLGAEEELAVPLTRFLGVPDPLPNGLSVALRAGILEYVGGPTSRALKGLITNSEIGASVQLTVPRGGNGAGTRVLARVWNDGAEPRQLRIGLPADPLFIQNLKGDPVINRKLRFIHPDKLIKLEVPGALTVAQELHATLPPDFGARAGRTLDLIVIAERGLRLEGLAVVPLTDELPPPAPEPWQTPVEAQPSDE